jgi:hypothetical protein
VATAQPAADLNFASKPELTVSTPKSLQRPRRGRKQIILIAVLTLLVVGGFAAALLLLGDKKTQPPREWKAYDAFNITLKEPASPWKRDLGLAEDMGSIWAWSRGEPNNFCALEVIDYEKEKRVPGKSSLIDVFKNRVDSYFPGMAWQPKAPATIEKLEKLGTLGKQEAYVLEFEGTRDNATYEGECHIMEYQGRVYWFFAFAPQKTGAEEKDSLRKEWAAVRSGFAVLDNRKDWRPTPRETSSAAGEGFSMDFPRDTWKLSRSGKKLVLQGTILKGDDGEDNRAGRSAELQVSVLDGKFDFKAAMTALREQFLAEQAEFHDVKRDDLELKVLSDSKGKMLEGQTAIGSARGYLSKNQLTIKGGTFDRFVVLAVIPRADQAVGITCESAFKRRDFWEQEIHGVLDTFQIARPKND